ncbi:heavy-metal-associated domain-containing protein [Croceitalea rosinachiae]|uniref:Heavy-metal-associated domain-containing protein n=1 Tax=Croceitalea rosinachiae TaxID=3075596 RepID=A0ABU3A9B1_9FLAO|nr:heavy-metal-associated domain-containing protein [Croceitalea sp. F388]MDT0606769.1 heavy-metal-associated domain-containing protein [Croceitalea sp. F388]
MKRTIIVTLVIGMMTMFSANAQKAMDKFMVQVDGLGCPFCAYGLEKKFKEFKGIKNVKIDIETGDFSFKYPAEKALTMQAVEKQVEKAGYTPVTSKIERANGKVEESKGAMLSDSSEGTITKKMMVAGNCGMCEARISKAAKSVNGVSEISWNKDTKMMEVSFDTGATSLTEIEMAIAKAGHDTKNHKAQKVTYDELPACCHYQRITK